VEYSGDESKMNAVWKFELLSGSIEAPLGAQFLSCQFQGHKICAWMLVDPNESRRVTIAYAILPTGGKHRLPRSATHWATLQDEDGLVWHIFGERPESVPV
jgi:hypothetical protein